jgi:hypothetical protein
MVPSHDQDHVTYTAGSKDAPCIMQARVRMNLETTYSILRTYLSHSCYDDIDQIEVSRIHRGASAYNLAIYSTTLKTVTAEATTKRSHWIRSAIHPRIRPTRDQSVRCLHLGCELGEVAMEL